jgi:hypothetical protein
VKNGRADAHFAERARSPEEEPKLYNNTTNGLKVYEAREAS